MIRIAKFAIVISILINSLSHFTASQACNYVSGQTVADITQTRIYNYHVENVGIEEALKNLADNHYISIGIVLTAIKKDRVNPLITIDEKDATVSEILDQIVRQSSEYKWSVTDGVINFVPAYNADEFINAILETKFDNFIVEKGTPRFQVRRSLLEHPDVVRKAKEHGMKSFIFQFGCGFSSCYLGGNPNFEINLKNMTMKQILNHLLIKSKQRFWEVYRIDDTYTVLL